MIERKMYLPLAAVAALGLVTAGCIHDDGPVTTPDPAAVANVIDLTANPNSTDGNSNWWHSVGFFGDFRTTGLSYRDGENPHLVVSNDDNGDLQLNLGLFDVHTTQTLGDSRVSHNRYIDTRDGEGEELEGATQSRRLIDTDGDGMDQGEELELRLTELTKRYENGGTMSAFIATDLQPGSTAIDPFLDAPPPGADIVIDDLDDSIRNGFDYVAVELKSTDSPIRGKLNGAPGEFSCSTGWCYLNDDREEGNYWTSSPNVVFTPDDGSGPVSVAHLTWGYASAVDYVAFGYWLYVPEDVTDTDAYSFGVFGSGGDLFEVANLEGVEGTASYHGDAMGMYFVDGLSSTPSTGYFTAEIQLDADFGSSSETGFVTGMVNEFNFEDSAHSALFPMQLYLGWQNDWKPDYFGVPRDSTNIFNTAWENRPDGWPDGATGGWAYGETSGGSEEWYGDWFGQFHNNGAAPTVQPTAIAGVLNSYLAAFDGNGNYVPGPADRGLAGGFAARQPEDPQ